VQGRFADLGETEEVVDEHGHLSDGATDALRRAGRLRPTGLEPADPSKLGEATVTINGTPLTDAGVGWNMPTPTELVLNGPACAAWRTSTGTIKFAFPCDTVLP
jgi:hypothetical protein